MGTQATFQQLRPIRFPPLPTTKELLKIYGVGAQKKLSQNFIVCRKSKQNFISKAKVRNCHVIELGPGTGAITRSIFDHGALFVHAIEKDKRMIPILSQLKDASHNRLHFHMGDILHFPMKNLIPTDLSKPWDDTIPKIRLVGNLPFNVASPLIIKYLELISLKADLWSHGRVPLTLTFQHEVGERMIASFNDYARSRLSIMTQNWCSVEYVHQIPNTAFVPQPEVDVAVMRFIPRKTPLIPVEFRVFEKVVRSIFYGRNKPIIKSICQCFPPSQRTEFTSKLIAVADINPNKTAAQLSFVEIERITYAYIAIAEETPSLSSYGYSRSNADMLIYLS